MTPTRWRSVAGLGIMLCVAALATVLQAEQGGSRDQLRQPLYRTSKARPDRPGGQSADEHPLDPALRTARQALHQIRSDVRDYSCTLVKRERIEGVLGDPQYIYTEVRNRKMRDGEVVTPFSVYMYFLKPADMKGHEVIYVEGRNKNKLVAHEGTGALKFAPPVWLNPQSSLAMRGQLYPITEVGIENLILELLETGERDRKRGECDVQFIENAKINGRRCTVLQVIHPKPRPYFDFHLARVFIDDELNVPIRYAAYTWPKKPGGKPQLQEEYTYLNLKLNVGLTEEDFNHKKKFR